MTPLQRLLYFDAATYSLTAPIIVMFALAPAIFVISDGISPFQIKYLYELCAVFGASFVLLQFTMWWAHRGTPGGMLEMWRATQVSFWLAPNSLKALYKVLISEVAWLKALSGLEVRGAERGGGKAGDVRVGGRACRGRGEGAMQCLAGCT